MEKIFISYGDNSFKVSLDRILRQAKQSKLFDRIIGFTPKDLPEYIRSSPLFAIKTGGGCWSWKPYIIYHTLQNCSIGDVVYYADAGCSLDPTSPEWSDFQSYVQSFSAIFFQYRSNFNYPGWEKYYPCSAPHTRPSAIEHWIKPSLSQYFLQFISPDFLSFDKIMAGFMIFKKTDHIISILEQWYQITLFHPELVTAPLGSEMSHLPNSFFTHRFDQSVLTPLVYHFKEKDNVLVLPETAESRFGQPAVLATRWKQAALRPFPYLKYRLSEFFSSK